MAKKVQILTHRGIEFDKKYFYPESSYEAFQDQLERGFGIEFDINFSKDEVIIFHDSNLKRITYGKDNRKISEIDEIDIRKIRYGKSKSHLALFEELLNEIEKSNSKLNALHLKGKFQTKENIDKVLDCLDKNKKASEKILIFDLKPEFANYIKNKNSKLKLAPSVAHKYDIKRYNPSVGGTLISVSSALKDKKIYDWVWLDEWDLDDKGNKTKKLYTKENFKKLRRARYKIALVTPELHGTSPGLYGGEGHQDAKNIDLLFKRIKEIIALKPDAICTDYPEEVKKLI